jgi:hypothetical protein
VLTKKEGMRVIGVWKEWHRRCGWEVKGNVATHPKTNELRAITLREYEAETRKRVA